jgi:hypothetical protein
MSYKVTKYPEGTFSWADSASTDANAAKQFYAAVMGWEIDDMPMGDGMFYTMFKQDGAHVAGLGPMPAEMKAGGMPSVWQSYVTVNDVDAMPEKIKALGGTVVTEPFDVFDSGRMMVLQDPTGAFLSLWQPKSHIGAGMVNAPGAMTWNELATRDVPKAVAFYGKLFGWDIQADDSGFYNTAMNKGRSNAGIMQLAEEWGDAPSNWMVYFSVANLAGTEKKVVANGGKIIISNQQASETGSFSIFSDPQGAFVAVIQLNKPDTWAE